ncbi:MAG: hypothetical protein H6738_07630 [Alphaproteobacteria bacterium]|nr:hypothetical protein [Alphaproteobacteria bacterium]MCB9696635.1 hypothetical protein [Alphaproteobacteria bacterium]
MAAARMGAGIVGVVVMVATVGFAVFRTDLLLSRLEVGPLGSEADADRVLPQLASAYGPADAWRALPAVELELVGEVPFVPARLLFGMAPTTPHTALTVRFEPGRHGVYGYVQDGVRGCADTRSERDGRGLLLDSVHHLFTLPFSVGDVPFRRSVSTAGPDGSTGTFLTWGDDPEPTSAFDQVVLWTDGGRIARMDTTGRDVAPFIVAAVPYDGTAEVEGAPGFLLPHTATIQRGPGGSIVHRWELRRARVIDDIGCILGTNP